MCGAPPAAPNSKSPPAPWTLPRAPSFNADAALLAEALIPLDADTRDPHWPLSARSLTAALIMYVAIEAARRRERPTMRRLRELLCLPSLPRSQIHKDGAGLPKLASIIMDLGRDDPYLWRNWQGMRNAAAQFFDYTKEVAGIASTARAQTASFDDAEIIADTARDGFDFREMKKRPVTVYICLPPDMVARQAKWLRLLLTAALQGVMRERRAGEPKTLFVLDEFFALGHLDVIARTWALVRGYGIQMMPVLQDLGQLKQLYPQNWETFLGMAGAVVSFAANDLTTAQWLSDQAGETQKMVKSISHNQSVGTSSGSTWGHTDGSNLNGGSVSKGGSSGTTFSDSTTTSWGPVKVPYISAHRLKGLPKDNLVGYLDGVADLVPIWGRDYLDMTEIEARARLNPYHDRSYIPLSDDGKAWQALSVDTIPLEGLYPSLDPLPPRPAGAAVTPKPPQPHIAHRPSPRGRGTWRISR